MKTAGVLSLFIGLVLVSGCHANIEMRALFPAGKEFVYEGKYAWPPAMHGQPLPSVKAEKYFETLNDFGIDKSSDGAMIFFNNSRFLTKRVVLENQQIFLECSITNTIRVYLGYQAWTSSEGVVPLTYIDITEKFAQKFRDVYQTYLRQIPMIDVLWRETVNFFENGYEIAVSEKEYKKVVGVVGNMVYGVDWKDSAIRIDMKMIKSRKDYKGWQYYSAQTIKKFKGECDINVEIYQQLNNQRTLIIDSGLVHIIDIGSISFEWILL